MQHVRGTGLWAGLCVLTASGVGMAADPATNRGSRHDAPIGPFPTIEAYCTSWRQKTESKLKGATPEDPPDAPYCKPDAREMDGLLSLKTPRAPFLSARIVTLFDWREKERDFRVSNGLAIQTAAGWYVLPHLWMGRWWDDTGCNAYEKWTVDSWEFGAPESAPLLRILYHLDTGERFLDEEGSNKGSERRSRTRYQLECLLDAQGRPLCTQRRLGHRAWKE